jgi:hypothetical protein
VRQRRPLIEEHRRHWGVAGTVKRQDKRIRELELSPREGDVTQQIFVSGGGGGGGTGGGGGSGAPTDALYVVMSSNGTLTAERVLTAGNGIAVVDGGSIVTVSQTARMKHFQISFGTTVGTGYQI